MKLKIDMLSTFFNLPILPKKENVQVTLTFPVKLCFFYFYSIKLVFLMASLFLFTVLHHVQLSVLVHFQIQFGHAGASANAKIETATAKNLALKEAGAHVPHSFDGLGDEIAKVSNG